MASASSADMRLEGVRNSLSSPLDHSRGGFADRGGCAKSPEPLDVRGQRTNSGTAGASCTVQLEIQHNSGGVGTAVHNPLDDGVDSAMWEVFCGEASTIAPSTDDLAAPFPTLEMNKPHQPLNTAALLPGSPNTDAALSDKCPIEEGDSVQRPQLDDSRERDNVSPTGEPSGRFEQEDILGPADVTSADTAPPKRPTCNGVRSSQSADFTDAADLADIEGSDGDRPPLTRRRRWTRTHGRGSGRTPSLLTSHSRAQSMEVDSGAASHRRKRLHQRKRMRHGSPTPGTDDTSTSSRTSMSRGARGERWPIQCVAERKMIGSQELITIEVPTFDLCAGSGRGHPLSSSADTSQVTPILDVACGIRRRTRFSRAEEELLMALKEQGEPKLSWREIQRRFPNRTTGSLQVHYSTRLKGIRGSRRRACRRS